MARPPSRFTTKLVYPEHQFKPEELLHFVESTFFSSSWDELGLDAEDDLTKLQLLLMARPDAGDVIRNSGGVRKLRFVPDKWKSGKRGGLRACYVYFEDFGIILLLLVYDKSEQDNLDADELKACRELIKSTKKYLLENHIRVKKHKK